MSKVYSIGPDGKLVFDKEAYAEQERKRLEKMRAMTDEELDSRLDLFAMADDHDWEWREFMNESERRRKGRKP